MKTLFSVCSLGAEKTSEQFYHILNINIIWGFPSLIFSAFTFLRKRGVFDDFESREKKKKCLLAFESSRKSTGGFECERQLIILCNLPFVCFSFLLLSVVLFSPIYPTISFEFGL